MSLHYAASPAVGLRVWVVWEIDFVLVAINKEAPRPPLPLVVDLGHRDHPHLVPLSQDLLLGELGGVAGHQLGRGHLDHLVIKTLHREHALTLLLIRNLAAVKKHCIGMLCYLMRLNLLCIDISEKVGQNSKAPPYLTSLMRSSGMSSLSVMCSLVLIFQEMLSWMKQRMLVVPSHVAQLTLPRAWPTSIR